MDCPLEAVSYTHLGFRDSCQDLLGFVHLIPDRARERIIDIASTQFQDGSAYHQYQPLTKKGNSDIGSGFNDDPLWLIAGTSAYVRETGDTSILTQMVPFDKMCIRDRPQNVLNTIKGTNLTVAFHSGNGVALSISGQDLKNKDLSKIQNIDLTVDQTSNTIPANVVSAKSGTVNRQLGIRDTGSFGVNVNIHVNVGKDNSGKSANLYRYNTEKGRLEYCGSFRCV